MFKKGYKQTEEHKRKIGLANSKKLKGRHISLKTEFKKGCISMRKGVVLSEETRKKLRLAKIGTHHTEKHNLKIRLSAKRGSDNPSWKGGLTPLYAQIRNCFEYRQWRSDVFTRDKFACQKCGDAIGGNLVAHHIVEFADIIERYEITTLEEALKCEEFWNINNGITLCEDCHIELHRKIK